MVGRRFGSFRTSAWILSDSQTRSGRTKVLTSKMPTVGRVIVKRSESGSDDVVLSQKGSETGRDDVVLLVMEGDVWHRERLMSSFLGLRR